MHHRKLYDRIAWTFLDACQQVLIHSTVAFEWIDFLEVDDIQEIEGVNVAFGG